MWANFTSAFVVRNGQVVMEKMALDVDGAQVEGTGTIDAAKWPESTFQITARHQLPRARAIFYAKEAFTLHGEGDFTGTVHKYSGGYEVKGEFVSPEVGYDDYRFQRFKASVVWVPTRFDVLAAEADLYGGRADFTYQLAPLGVPQRRPDATWDVSYRDVDLTTFTNFLETRGLRLAGRATGRNTLTWTLGRLADAVGEGSLTAVMPPGVVPATRVLPGEAVAAVARRAEDLGPFSPHNALGPLPVAGQVDYTFDGSEIRFTPSSVATAETFVAFEGRTAWGQASRLPFHVTSSNWQESHRFLTGIMTMVATPTAATPIDGVGDFDGVVLGALANPQVEGTFAGRAMRAWNVTWGDIEGEVVIADAYAYVKNVVVRNGVAGRMDVEGTFALGYPRRDGGEEIDARIRVAEWPLTDYRAAFELYDYPVFGAFGGEIHVYGKYQEPFGFGRITIDRGTAYDEPFATAVSSLRFEGAGVRLDGLEIQKAGTTITGAAYVGWDGAYSFNADGRRLAVDALGLTYFPGLPALSGYADFSAAGSGTFEEPRYDVKVSVFDLFVGDEGIGQMTAQVTLRGLTVLYSFDIASPRLAASGTGQYRLDRGRRDRDDHPAVGHLARPLRAGLPADAVAVHGGHRQRHGAGLGRGLHAQRAACRVGRRRPAGAAVRLRAAQPRCAAPRPRRADHPRRAVRPHRGPHRTRCQRPGRPRARRGHAAGQRRRQPGRAPGRPARSARRRPRRDLGADRRHYCHADPVGQRPHHRRTPPNCSPSRTPSRRSTASSPSTPRRCASTGCAPASPTAACSSAGASGCAASPSPTTT